MGRINLLDPLLSSRIAAGEVIERPQSVLREFLDNSLDAEADDITVIIEGGGIDKLEVQDNGKGINREDLSLIATRHATSKIHNPDDLYEINYNKICGLETYPGKININDKYKGDYNYMNTTTASSFKDVLGLRKNISNLLSVGPSYMTFSEIMAEKQMLVNKHKTDEHKRIGF